MNYIYLFAALTVIVVICLLSFWVERKFFPKYAVCKERGCLRYQLPFSDYCKKHSK